MKMNIKAMKKLNIMKLNSKKVIGEYTPRDLAIQTKKDDDKANKK
jgi:hypothetical protein